MLHPVSSSLGAASGSDGEGALAGVGTLAAAGMAGVGSLGPRLGVPELGVVVPTARIGLLGESERRAPNAVRGPVWLGTRGALSAPPVGLGRLLADVAGVAFCGVIERAGGSGGRPGAFPVGAGTRFIGWGVMLRGGTGGLAGGRSTACGTRVVSSELMGSMLMGAMLLMGSTLMGAMLLMGATLLIGSTLSGGLVEPARAATSSMLATRADELIASSTARASSSSRAASISSALIGVSSSSDEWVSVEGVNENLPLFQPIVVRMVSSGLCGASSKVVATTLPDRTIKAARRASLLSSSRPLRRSRSSRVSTVETDICARSPVMAAPGGGNEARVARVLRRRAAI